MSVRIQRIAEQIRAEVARVLREESSDPRIGMLTVTRVKVSADLSEAIVFWSPLTVTESVASDEMADGLDSASGFVRRRLLENLNLRRTPALHFRHDPSVAEGSRTLALLRSLPDVEGDDPGVSDEGAEAAPAREGRNGEEA